MMVVTKNIANTEKVGFCFYHCAVILRKHSESGLSAFCFNLVCPELSFLRRPTFRLLHMTQEYNFLTRLLNLKHFACKWPAWRGWATRRIIALPLNTASTITEFIIEIAHIILSLDPPMSLLMHQALVSLLRFGCRFWFSSCSIELHGIWSIRKAQRGSWPVKYIHVGEITTSTTSYSGGARMRADTASAGIHWQRTGSQTNPRSFLGRECPK